MDILHRTGFLLQKCWRPRVVVPLFFVALIVLGVAIHRDYGMSWDELNMYHLGREAWNYVFHLTPWPQDAGRRFHGPAFELFLYWVEQLLLIESVREVFFLRHLLNYFSFVAGVWFFYCLARRHFQSSALGLLGALLLVLTPGIFSHAFYNSRDIPAMSCFILAALTLVRTLDKPGWRRIMLHGAVCGFLVSIRITGVLLPVLTCAFFLLLHLGKKGEFRDPRWTLGMGTLFCAVTAASTYLFWPFLWQHPVAHFLEAVRYGGSVGGLGLYMGRAGDTFAWHYTFVWIAITVPVSYTVLALVGIGRSAQGILRRPFLATLIARRNDVLFFLWFFAPIAVVTILKSGNYDQWRHLYFVYPAFLMFTLAGVRFLLIELPSLLWRAQGLRIAALTAALLLWTTLSTALWMVRSHPLQNLYFTIPARLVEGNFETDYWGIAFRPAMEEILRRDPDPSMVLLPTSTPGYYSFILLPPEDRKRIFFASPLMPPPKYILDNFRTNEYRKKYPDADRIFSIFVDGIEALAVYKNSEWQQLIVEEGAQIPDWDPRYML